MTGVYCRFDKNMEFSKNLEFGKNFEFSKNMDFEYGNGFRKVLKINCFTTM